MKELNTKDYLETLLEAAKSHNKTLKMTTKVYHELLSLLIQGAKGEVELAETQVSYIKVLLDEHRDLHGLVKEIDGVIHKINTKGD